MAPQITDISTVVQNLVQANRKSRTPCLGDNVFTVMAAIFKSFVRCQAIIWTIERLIYWHIYATRVRLVNPRNRLLGLAGPTHVKAYWLPVIVYIPSGSGCHELSTQGLCKENLVFHLMMKDILIRMSKKKLLCSVNKTGDATCIGSVRKAS